MLKMINPVDPKTWSLSCTPSDDLDSGDKIILPPSLLNDLITSFDKGASNPITLSISLPETPQFNIHVGVREFSSVEGCAVIPRWLFNDLLKFFDDETSVNIVIKEAQLQKGTWAKFVHKEGDMKVIKNVRAMFEASLRSNFTALTRGQIIRSTYGGKSFSFVVEELKPEDAVSIVDTDLEIDIIAPTVISGEEELFQSTSQTIPKKLHPETKISLTKLSKEKHVFEFSWEIGVPFYIELSCDKSVGPNLFLLPEKSEPSEDKHIWVSYGSSREKNIVINSKDPQFKSSQYTLAVEGGIDCRYSLFVGIHVSKDAEVLDSSQVTCSNCFTAVSKEKYQMHEIFCSRNNIACHSCNKVFLKKEFSQHWHCPVCSIAGDTEDENIHMAFFHEPNVCSCGASCEGRHGLSRHKIIDCPERLMECRYCHILVAHGSMSQKPEDLLLNLTIHESYCGDKTITCTKCSTHVSLKKVRVHAKYHEYLRQRQPLPFKRCSNFGCSRPQPKETNAMSLCQSCFGPFWSPNHDPGYKNLMSRVARRYHLQLTQGCQNSWCINPHCATSSGNALDPTSAAIALVSFLKVPLPVDGQCFLCVDSASAQKWVLLQQLLEQVNNKYLIEWCIKALESSDQNVKQAAKWLSSNAPSQNAA
ncbi:hypothetical protein DSO57_1023183 [Entomophthora muscae]|uniref:Uncharacterized protein n=1 Tax=Entomophthora muscae TaxID=34485 RepID=A0ACC2T2Z9_9FUNG|nr:hypothetical protein DSO57_1023183 [Entomophthora muscae]